MKNNYYYKTCPICGAALDPGERCDCDPETTTVKTDFVKASLNVGERGGNVGERKSKEKGRFYK